VVVVALAGATMSGFEPTLNSVRSLEQVISTWRYVDDRIRESGVQRAGRTRLVEKSSSFPWLEGWGVKDKSAEGLREIFSSWTYD